MSNTMTIAISSLSHSENSVQPRSAVEQYWAARALTAERLLSARMVGHGHDELRRLTYAEEVKKHWSKTHGTEKLVLAMMLMLVLLLSYLLHRQNRQWTDWTRPSTHFTIPILSPFTSVVEHDSSVLGPRTIAVFALVLGILGYSLLRKGMK